MTGKQLGAMHEKDKKSGPPTSGHFEAADNGGFHILFRRMERANTAPLSGVGLEICSRFARAHIAHPG